MYKHLHYPYALHAPPISFFSILSPAKYLPPSMYLLITNIKLICYKRLLLPLFTFHLIINP
jgi:hypothetical protein